MAVFTLLAMKHLQDRDAFATCTTIPNHRCDRRSQRKLPR